MTHELDDTIQQAVRTGCTASHGQRTDDVARMERVERIRTGDARARPRDSVRMGLCSASRPLTGSTLRVIETTWRLWREPHGG